MNYNTSRKMILNYDENLQEVPHIIKNNKLYFTYQPDAVENNMLLQEHAIKNNSQYRKYMTHNAQQIISNNSLIYKNYNKY